VSRGIKSPNRVGPSSGRLPLAGGRGAGSVGYASALKAGIATSNKLTLPSMLSGRATETIAVSLKLSPLLLDEAILRGQDRGDRSIRRGKAFGPVMLTTLVAFVEALSALTKDESKTCGKEAWSLV
jgi:hypothetical protein